MADQALTEAQQRAARIVLDTVGEDGFRLAGGAALVATGLTSRPTRDIDAFTNLAVNMPVVVERVKEALEADGFEVTIDRVFPGFAAVEVTAGRRGRFSIDLGRDHFEWPPVTTEFGPSLSPRELAASKVLALFSRVQPRDLADVMTLAEKLDIEQVFADAKLKDAGFNRPILAEMIRRVIARPDVEWPDGVDIAAARTFGARLAASLEGGAG